MVARLAPVESISETLSYNEEKVTQHRAECIHSKNFLQDTGKLSYADKLERFQRLNDLNSRSRVKMLHATLNFEPAEKLSNAQLADIADRYMQGLKMEDQPYLVYRHQDSNHPHIHIVSSLIQPDGRRINTHRMAIRLSEPIRKAIQQEFQLLPSQRPKRSPVPSPNEVQKFSPETGLPVTQQMDRILSAVNRHYHFSSLHEYNAILRSYNVLAETGGPGSKTRRHNGIYYLALDDKGNKISPPVMASQLPGRPTLSRLEHKFHHPDADHLDRVTSIRQRIDWVLDQQPPNFRALVSRLQGESIEIVQSARNGRNPHDQVYVDHRTRTAVTGQTLGPGYTAAAVGDAFGQHRSGQQQHNQLAQIPEAPRFSANVPQVLSAMLQTKPGSPGPDDFGQQQNLGPRRKI